MSEKYLLFNLDDEKAKKLGEVISNSTCKKIINLLAEKEASEAEIARELKIPINTAEYNLRKLIDAGLIEKSKQFWSVKGRKIETYKVVNKNIVISPKKISVYSKLKSVVPVVLISGLLTGFIRWYYKSGVVRFATEKGAEIAEEGEKVISSLTQAGQAEAVINKTAVTVAEKAAIAYSNPWLWFALGAGIVIIAFIIWNWKKL